MEKALRLKAALLLGALSAWAAPVPGWGAAGPRVEKLSGDRLVYVISHGEQKNAVEGMELEAWSQIRTSPGASVSIRYPDGSVIVVARGSSYETKPMDTSGGEPQWNQLNFGDVHGVIQKRPEDAKKAVQGEKPPIKFLIRTKTATMGVRGTDFFFGSDAATGKSEVHTLSGEVDFAPSDSALRTGQGVQVMPGTSSSASYGGVSEPARFQPQQYLQEVREAKPELLTLAPKVDESGHIEAAPGDSGSPQSEVRASTGQTREVKSLIEDLLGFELSAMYVKQDISGYPGAPPYKDGGIPGILTGEASWNPSLQFHDFLGGALGLRGHAGIFMLKDGIVGQTFDAIRFGGFATLRVFGPFGVEAGLLQETWLGGYGDSQLMPAANLSYELGYNRLFERIFVGASRYDGGPGRGGLLQVNAGLGFQL